MTHFTLVVRNLFEKRARTLLLGFSAVVAFVIFGVLNGFINLIGTLETPASQSRLLVANSTGLLRGIPVSYAEKIREMSGVKQAASVSLLPGYVREETNVLAVLMVDPANFLAGHPLAGLSDEAKKAFVAGRDGMIVDRETAAANGWNVGDRVIVRSKGFFKTDGSNNWQFTIAGVFDPTGPDGSQSGAIGQYEYMNANLPFGQGIIHWVSVTVDSPKSSDEIAQRIDANFANSANETKTQSEVAMAQAFIGQLGDLEAIVRMVVGAAFLALLFVIGNTTALTIRRRSRQIGVMKTLGFSPASLLLMTLGETMLLALTSATIGLLLAAFLFSGIVTAMSLPVPQFGLPGISILQGYLLAILLGLLTGILPALRAMRVSPVAAFGRE